MAFVADSPSSILSFSGLTDGSMGIKIDAIAVRGAAVAARNETRCILVGDTITGEWYSHYAKQGWYRYVGRVLPDSSIEQSQSDDPVRSNIKTAVLTRKP